MIEEKASKTAPVLGSLSLVFWLIPLFGLPIAILGLLLSVRGKARRKLATVSLICSIIGFVLGMANFAMGAYLAATGQHSLVNWIMQCFFFFF
ncbi:hypothetical protein D6783_05290 [Candidatus Woesearchaeota archaeon]|nr:MAG: hypothetical protein D6783_05290 [Candidatus Woesearchaeota archaeon]